MARVRQNFFTGTLSSQLLAGATTLMSAALSGFPVVTAPDIAYLVIDPEGSTPEIVQVTAHTASATTATVVRGRDSTTDRAWAAGTLVIQAAIASDYVPLRSFDVANYGTVDTTGVTDSSTAVLAAIQAAYDAGGGIVQFPGGVIRIDSQLAMPNDGASVPNTKPIYLEGQGSRRSSLLTAALSTVPGGTTLDLRSSTGPAKIDTRGAGVLGLSKLTLTNLGTADTNPFIQTTNTLLKIDDLAIWGHASKTGTACNQDAIVLGGTSATEGNASTSAFRGFGTVINDVFFSNIRRGIYGRAAMNSVYFNSLTFSTLCGSDNTAAAIELDGSTGGCAGNFFNQTLIEMHGYVYGIKCSTAVENVFTQTAWWDAGGSTLFGVLLDSGSVNNQFLGTYVSGLTTAQLISSATTALLFQSGTFIRNAKLESPIVKRTTAAAAETDILFGVYRADAEAVSPGAAILTIKQNGSVNLSGASKGLTIGNTTFGDADALVKASGNCLIYAGSSTNSVKIERGVLRVSVSTTAGRPSASTVGSGSHLFDSTLGKPIWSNGTNWVDATGTTV